MSGMSNGVDLNLVCCCSQELVSPGYEQVDPGRFSVDGSHVQGSEATRVLDIHLANPIQIKANSFMKFIFFFTQPRLQTRGEFSCSLWLQGLCWPCRRTKGFDRRHPSNTNDTLTKKVEDILNHLSIDQPGVDVGTACEQEPKD